jgi:hypothetical protein
MFPIPFNVLVIMFAGGYNQRTKLFRCYRKAKFADKNDLLISPKSNDLVLTNTSAYGFMTCFTKIDGSAHHRRREHREDGFLVFR